MATINFYHQDKPYGCFSNFSRHAVAIGGQVFPTSEHYFQATKFEGTPHYEAVRQCSTPSDCAFMGRDRSLPLRPDWEEVKEKVMFDVCLAKFTQHRELRETLLGTRDAKLVEHTTNDRYWGDGGGDGRGKNRLGIILMQVRDAIRLDTPEAIAAGTVVRIDADNTGELYSCLALTSQYPITTPDGTTYPTLLHAYLAFQFAQRPEIVQQLFLQAKSMHDMNTIMMTIASIAGDHEHDDETMYQLMSIKITQHSAVRDALASTPSSSTILDVTQSYPRELGVARHWATLGDGSGKNMFGIMLMRMPRFDIRKVLE
eukprot:PhM_4_TR4113/c0_g1_i1/m.64369/K09935/K09935; uncharacterized protein